MFQSIIKPGVAVLMVCAVGAQEECEGPLALVITGAGENVFVDESLPAIERLPVLSKAWQHLGRIVRRDDNGNAKALHRSGDDEAWIEWMNLRIEAVHNVGVSKSDLMNGVTRRYNCEIACDAHRIWDSDRIAWSGWVAGNYRGFPWRIEVSWERGKWIARARYDGEFIAPGNSRGSGESGIFRVMSDGSEAPVVVR